MSTGAFEARMVAIESEQAVLGCLLRDNDAIDRISGLAAVHFYLAQHRTIFETIFKMLMTNQPVDIITVHGRLVNNGKTDIDLSYLNELLQSTPSSALVATYAANVKDKAVKRGLSDVAHEAIQMTLNSPEDGIALVDKVSSRLETLSQVNVKNEPQLASSTMTQFIEELDEVYSGGGTKALSTGFIDLDEKLNGGLRPGNLIIVAARPKAGKSAFASNIANNVAEAGYVVMELSMEMTVKDIHARNVASVGGIHMDHVIDAKKLTDEDWPRLTHAIQKIHAWQLYLDDEAALTLMRARAKMKQIKRRAGRLDLVVIDYLQLMSGSNQGDNRNTQIEEITRGLKNTAKELGTTIILLSQLNRKLEDRPNKRPMPADLRDSGAIEQDCDIAIFLYRDEVYNPDSMDKGICEVNVALNRQGAAGMIGLNFIGEHVKFQNAQRGWHPAPPKTKPAKHRGFADSE
jgi:replicative DNA helicase